ncbi:chloride channel protein [Bifidobacterium apri]|uniref:Chloride channel protein n=1 Tax=Bifidobacterium apri TaxID=1769423 RepID=A0A6A2VDB6_9BIFI|nr:chloride channel protein [Bifidobacterium apri]KAB8294470.1 chloride channel protein [Bifidobacterium apri]
MTQADDTDTASGRQSEQERPDAGKHRLARFAAAVALASALAGVAAGLLTLMLYGVEHLFLGYVEGVSAPGPFAVPAWRRAVSVFVGLSVAAVIWWLLRTRTTRVPSVKQAVGGSRMPAWQTVVHVMLQIFIVGSGASIGREVAPRELGALLGQRFARLTRLGKRDTRTLVAIAAAAGLAGVYNAPLAGTFFAAEILLHDISLETVALSFGGSALAAWTASLVKGTHTFYDLGRVSALFTPDLIAFALVAGLVCGACGAVFRRGSAWAESHKSTGVTLLWTMPLAGAATGIAAIWLPQMMGNGRALGQLSFSSDVELSVIPGLLIGFVMKAVLTLLTIRSGASGGVLQPGIALGASMGAILGVLWMTCFHTNTLAVYALIGACALLSASQQAPLMATCLVMELAAAPVNLFVPAGCAVAVSVVVCKVLMPHLDAWHPLARPTN